MYTILEGVTPLYQSCPLHLARGGPSVGYIPGRYRVKGGDKGGR